MGPAFYVLAIMGCGEADTACQQVAVAPARYESIESCNAATADAVERNSDLLFPVVVAQCHRADSKLAQLTPAEVALPEPDRNPQIRRATLQQKFASR